MNINRSALGRNRLHDNSHFSIKERDRLPLALRSIRARASRVKFYVHMSWKRATRPQHTNLKFRLLTWWLLSFGSCSISIEYAIVNCNDNNFWIKVPLYFILFILYSTSSLKLDSLALIKNNYSYQTITWNKLIFACYYIL